MDPRPGKKIRNGVSVLALRSKTDIFLIALNYKSFWTLNTWDKFRIPKPFSEVIVDCREISYWAIQNLSLSEASFLLECELKSM